MISAMASSMASPKPIIAPPIPTVRDAAALDAVLKPWREAGETIALVPTMGAIHDGHLALVRAARSRADHMVASLFVNPAQFVAGEDLESYPGDEAADAGALAAAGVELLFAPGVAEMYPAGFATTVEVSGLTEGLCGVHRPGHFAGVATVVAKLLNQCRPDFACFGEKDYQQLLVVKRLVRDLHIGVEIVAVPTVRAADGLALSSRNSYLTDTQRLIAPALYRTLSETAARLADGAGIAGEIDRATAALLDAGFDSVDYVALCDAETLEPLTEFARPARLLAAVHLGPARLIDNLAVG
jgi:pantoate--beta-alanine ligase